MTKITAAKKIANELREIAELVEKVGQGDEAAKKKLEQHIDGYWHAIVVGKKDIHALLADEE
jgi:hypothetical protein